MAEKNTDYKTLVNAIANSGLTDDEIEKNYPEIWKWWKSTSDSSSREKRLESKMGNTAFQKELLQWDDFKDHDFSKYKEFILPENFEDVPMKDIEDAYQKIKRILDPKMKLGKKELYETSGDKTFQQLENKFGPNYEGDWFGNLIDYLGYPDTAEGYEQLTQDLETILRRKKIADKSEKYGGFVNLSMLNSMDRMKEGFKPTAGDYAADILSNAAWMVPGGTYLKGLQNLRLAPQLKNMVKAEEMLQSAKLFKDFSPTMAKSIEESAQKLKEPLLKRILAGVESNAVAPIINETGKYALGSGNKDIGETLKAGATETAVNMASPLSYGTNLVGKTLGLVEKQVPGSFPGEMASALSNLLKTAEHEYPGLMSYIDNRMGNDYFAEAMKNISLKGLQRFFGVGKDEEQK